MQYLRPSGSGLTIALVLIVGILSTLGPVGDLAAQNPSGRTLTILSAQCPPGYAGSASADECDNNPLPGVRFRVGRPFTDAFTDFASTSMEGLASFEFDGMPLNGTLRIVEEIPLGTDRIVVYCVDDAGSPLEITYVDYAQTSPDIGVVDVSVGVAGNVACDWYHVPVGTGPATRSAQADEVQFTGEPSWWVVPRAPGYGNTDEGNLYFGVLVQNPTSSTVSVGVSFRAYAADGTPFPGCQASGGEGPGVTTTLAPFETALLSCSRTIVPRTLEGLQVTARLWDVTPLRMASMHELEVIEYGLVSLPEESTPMEAVYDAYALVRAVGQHDVDVAVRFRFYDLQGVQIGTCESNLVSIEPEVAQRLTCGMQLIVDTGSPPPVQVRVERLPMVE